MLGTMLWRVSARRDYVRRSTAAAASLNRLGRQLLKRGRGATADRRQVIVSLRAAPLGPRKREERRDVAPIGGAQRVQVASPQLGDSHKVPAAPGEPFATELNDEHIGGQA